MQCLRTNHYDPTAVVSHYQIRAVPETALVCLHYLPAALQRTVSKHVNTRSLIATCNQTVISRGKNYDDTHGVTQITQHFCFAF